ncbi:MAG: RNase adapter RapZ [Sutterella sp.]|nr:RNase adapter RapZ [Sutterella sp.]
MQLTLVTGMSGAGKSIVIRQLEDCGYYCVDNLPADFLVPLAHRLHTNGTEHVAVAIDARSQATFDHALSALKSLQNEGVDVRVLFLTASQDELVKRFSETRRRHPLCTRAQRHDQLLTLPEAIQVERDLLAPITELACVMDTTHLLPAQLRQWVQQFIGHPHAEMTLTFESFAFKHGLPIAADLVFDVRCLPNPYYDPALRPLTGKDPEIVTFMEQHPQVADMVSDIQRFIEKWLPLYLQQNRHYLTVAIGCTGGQHRSVYVAETLTKALRTQCPTIVRHRIIEQKHLLNTQRGTQTL